MIVYVPEEDKAVPYLTDGWVAPQPDNVWYTVNNTYEITEHDFNATFGFKTNNGKNTEEPAKFVIGGLKGSRLYDTIKKGSKIELFAGYLTETGDLPLVYTGYVDAISSGSEYGGNALHLKMSATGFAKGKTRIFKTYSNGESVGQVIQDMQKYLQLPPPYIPNPLFATPAPKNLTVDGNVYRGMENLLADFGYLNVIDNKQSFILKFLELGQSVTETEYHIYLPEKRQIVGDFKLEDDKSSSDASKGKVKMTTLLQHYKPNAIIRLDAEEHETMYAGDWVVEGIKYSLNYRGQDWYAKLDLIRRGELAENQHIKE